MIFKHSIHVYRQLWKISRVVARLPLKRSPINRVWISSHNTLKKKQSRLLFHINDANFKAGAYWESFRARNFKTDVSHFESVASPHHLLCVLCSFALNLKRVSVAFLITFSCIFNKFAFKICNIITSSPDTHKINVQIVNLTHSRFHFVLTSN